MPVVDMLSKLDDMAAKTGNFVSGIDLNPYKTEEIEHNVKPSMEYAEDVAKLIFCPPEDVGVCVAQALQGKFHFRSHELTIWTGYKGHGKSQYMSQCLMQFLKAGEKVFIVSPEFTPARVLERMVYQHNDSRNISEERLVAFFNAMDGLMWLYSQQHSLKPDDVIALCRFAVDKYNVNHVVIDSLMKCGIPNDDYTRQKNFVDKLQSIAHTTGVHVHLVAHARKDQDDGKPPRLHDVKGASEIADMAENVVVVWRNKAKEKDTESKKSLQEAPDALFVVEAQRNADGWIGTVPLWFNGTTYSESTLTEFF